MLLQDCVAFACTYLDDIQLHTYIRKSTMEVVNKGYIHGLFLTGLTDSGIQLLTSFVNEVSTKLVSVEGHQLISG